MIPLIQHFEADFLWKVSLKILHSGIILKTFTHALTSSEGSDEHPHTCSLARALAACLHKEWK